MDYVAHLLFIIGCVLVIISSFSAKTDFRMSNLWPESFYSLMIGAVIIIQCVFNLSNKRIDFVKVMNEEGNLKYTLIKLHLFMYILYATVSNIVFATAGINTSDFIFQNFPTNKINICFSYALAIIFFFKQTPIICYIKCQMCRRM